MTRSRVLSGRLRDRVLVTLKTGETFDGILYSHDDKALALRQAAAVGAGENSIDLPLDGEILVLLPNVAWIQRP